MAIQIKRGEGPPPELLEGQLGLDMYAGTLYGGTLGEVVTQLTVSPTEFAQLRRLVEDIYVQQQEILEILRGQ